MSHTMDNRQGKGTALYARKLIENMLGDERFEFTLVHYERVDDPIYKKVREIVIPEIPHLPFGTRFIRTMLFFWKHRKEDFDIIHWFQPRLYPFFWLAPARHIVVTAHGAGDITAPGQFPLSRRVYNFIMTYFNRWISAVIGVSEFGKKEIISSYRIAKDKVHAIYNGGGENFKPLDKTSAQARICQKYGIRAPFILDVSRLEPHKNVDSLIRAYEAMRLKSAHAHTLVVAGAHRYKAEKTVALARASQFSKDIRFINFVSDEDMNMLYSASDLFVFPSLNEGFGLPIVEALASGAPVITSNSASMPEIAGDAAITVDPLDIKALAEAMQSVLSDAPLRDSLIRKGLARAREFTWSKTARETSELYKQICSVEDGRK